jgi:hypothetical protein
MMSRDLGSPPPRDSIQCVTNASPMAAILRGCETTTRTWLPTPLSSASSSRKFGIWVLLPQPVSPVMSTTRDREVRMASRNDSLALAAGRRPRVSSIWRDHGV